MSRNPRNKSGDSLLSVMTSVVAVSELTLHAINNNLAPMRGNLTRLRTVKCAAPVAAALVAAVVTTTTESFHKIRMAFDVQDNFPRLTTVRLHNAVAPAGHPLGRKWRVFPDITL